VSLAWSITKVVLALFGIIAGAIIITKIVARLAELMKDKDDTK